MNNINIVITRYYNWLENLISYNKLSTFHKLLIYDSLILFDKFVKYDRMIFNNFINETKLNIDNIEFDEMKILPKFYLCLYAYLNNDKSKTSIFIQDWIKYIKDGDISNYDFPFNYWRNYSQNIPLKTTSFETSQLKDIVDLYSNTINMQTLFGTNNEQFELSDSNFHFLEAIMILLYKKEYNLIFANSLLRSLHYVSHKNSFVNDSALNYLYLQQNHLGYFGNYLKTTFDDIDINSILNISFDSIQTLLEFSNPDFRLLYEIKIGLEI